MWKRKKFSSPTETKPQSADSFCVAMIRGFEEKATHNKSESMLCFWTSMGGSLLVPVFVTLGPGMAGALGFPGAGFWLGKVIPSLLSVCVAFSTGWLQLRKPQQLWPLYRTSQRELEDNLHKYRFSVDDYSDAGDRDKLLVERATKIARDAHYAWLPMVPNPEKKA
ncbi:DUF4231 domain-containing protein [Acidithiobacillus ferriphilus]|uniref:DUF4231 domain-containing protein n=1 Tax=Acidithiobacillus ferriphilus TaxID=1689834 RepID=UPI002DBE7A32|nr:DUF4231 domain-containing protein [Acidithiobacillus ferriphilus]MEB8475011.1 DUF4231 domain-containing protein [Acidithiobacillus ferriphilus]